MERRIRQRQKIRVPFSKMIILDFAEKGATRVREGQLFGDFCI